MTNGRRHPQRADEEVGSSDYDRGRSGDGAVEATVKYISFSWTTPALLAGRKTVTRRRWSPRYAGQFHKGDMVVAFDKLQRNHGKRVALLALTHDPVFENIANAPEEDFESEGLRWMAETSYLLQGQSPWDFWCDWKLGRGYFWVIRFRIISR